MKARTGLAAAALIGTVAMGAPAFAAEGACAGKPGPNRLTVQISGVQPVRGEVAVTVYPDDARRFLARRGKLYRERVKAQAPVTSACFHLDPGVYAIAVYHDVNADRDFNRTAIGMPAEGFGFSNDAPTRFGLPSFDSVRFRVRPGQTSVAIRMRYQH
jgi:uncharacterized protein (DUF2141 family)